MEFQEWWANNKERVCHDITKRLHLDLNNPNHEGELMHIACLAWVACSMNNTTTEEHDNQN